MKLKKVTDWSGRECIIDEESRKLAGYNNRKHIVKYNARIIENGDPTQFWTDYTEEGTVDDLEERLQKPGNVIQIIYAKRVKYNAGLNDPDGKIWKELVEKVRKREDVFFTKDGDFRKRRRHKK